MSSLVSSLVSRICTRRRKCTRTWNNLNPLFLCPSSQPACFATSHSFHQSVESLSSSLSLSLSLCVSLSGLHSYAAHNAAVNGSPFSFCSRGFTQRCATDIFLLLLSLLLLSLLFLLILWLTTNSTHQDLANFSVEKSRTYPKERKKKKERVRERERERESERVRERDGLVAAKQNEARELPSCTKCCRI